MSDSVRLELIKKATGLVEGFTKNDGEYYTASNPHHFRVFVCRCLVVIICLLLIQSGEKMTDARLLH